MSHSTTIIGEITQRSLKKYGNTSSYVQAKEWWLLAAREWKAELEKEGLTKSIEAVNKAIEFMERTK